MKWINTKDKLPEENKYVLARYNGGNWHDSDDQKNVNCVVVKLVKGLSKNDRELMKNNKLLTAKEKKRCTIYQSSDEHGNNLVPYNWKSFGVMSFFGQDITYWTAIEPLSKHY